MHAARVSEPRHSGDNQHSPPISQFLSPSSHPCWRQPQGSHGPCLGRATLHPLQSHVIFTPEQKGHFSPAFYQLPPAHLKMERRLEKLWSLGSWSTPAHLCHHSPSTGSLAAALPGKGLQSSLTGQHFICFAIRLHPALQLQSLITSERCQQFNPNPVRFTILLLTLLIFTLTTFPSCQEEKCNPQTLSVKLHLPSKGWSTPAQG